MHSLLEQISDDRALTARMLELFEYELHRLQAPHSDADYRLLRDFAYFFRHYPGAVHFPTEDVVYRALADRDDKYREQADALTRRHARHLTLAVDLFGLLESVVAGHVVPRARLLKEASAYVTLHREHLEAVDASLFETASTSFPSDELDELARRVENHVDPEIRERTRDEFTRLCAALSAEITTRDDLDTNGTAPAGG